MANYLLYYSFVIPADLHEYLVACVGASASFIGLLFVGLSVVLQKSATGQQLPQRDRLQAQGAYTALVNIFFVTLSALLPQTNIGSVCIVMGALGIISCLRLRSRADASALIMSALIYLGELILGIAALIHSQQSVNIGSFQAVVILLFGLSLYRAWNLTGIRSKTY